MASKESQRKLLSPSTVFSGSENCNPNVVPGSCKRKIAKSGTAEQLPESNSTPKPNTGHACAEFNLISPPRKHVCSSRRCASKNPDYAVPVIVNPKNFLASKRHVLPPKGAATLCKCCLRKSKGEDGTADDQNGSMEICIRCSHEPENRRWSSDDTVSAHLPENGAPIALSIMSPERQGNNADSGQTKHCEQAAMTEAVGLEASETAHQECFTDTPKSGSRQNDWPNLQRHHHLQTVSDVNHLEGSISPKASASSSGRCGGSESKQRAVNLFASEELYCFGASCLSSTLEQSTLAPGDDEGPSQMVENEEAAASPSPEKSGNWRLNAVLEALGNLSPTREGRVKTLVRAFESLLSVTDRKGEQQARKPRYPFKFSYLNSNANLGGEEIAQKEEFTDGEEGESEKEEASDAEEPVEQRQTNLWKGDVKNEGIGEDWQSPHGVHCQSVVEDREDDGVDEEWLQQRECVESSEQAMSNIKREDGLQKVLRRQEAQEDNAQSSVVDAEDSKEGVGEQWQLPVVVSDEKQCQSHKEDREYAHSFHRVSDDEMNGMKTISQKQEDREFLAHSAIEKDGEEDDKKKKHDEEQVEGVHALTVEKGDEIDEEQPSDVVSTQCPKKVLIEGEADKDSVSQELETRHAPALSVSPLEAASEEQPPNQKFRTNLQRRLSQKSIDGHFAFKAARKQQNSRIRESVRVSSCSISSTRPPLMQKSQMQSAQDKPRISKPQPFKLLTEARGHMKEQEFIMKLKKILDEEEKLRVPLAQGLPWTTDEPEIPYKPPVKENTKPLDIQLYSDLRAMERAEFDRFIAEKLLYIEQRRMEEECLRKAAEEEEIKRMRQEMVPKAQLMPYFDRPFRPRRSSKRPTIPKEPQFQYNKEQSKRQKCAANTS